MNRLINLTLALALSCAMAAAGTIFEGPSAQEIEAAQAADLADAKAAAQAHMEHVTSLVKKCRLLRGPSAELLQIRGTDDYVCREGQIEPTPAEVLGRYAQMGSGE